MVIEIVNKESKQMAIVILINRLKYKIFKGS